MSQRNPNSEPYAEIDADEFTLRDRLAIERTLMSNERTVLAYGRTSLTLLAIGVTFLHFAPGAGMFYILHILGFFFLTIGALVLSVGTLQFVRAKRRMNKMPIDRHTRPDS